MTDRTYTFHPSDVLRLHKLVDGHCQALKNWIVSAVENNDLAHAKTLVADLRVYQDLFARTNVESHRLIDASKQ